MRAAAIAAAVFAAFVGVMYLRFSGDAVPSPEPRPSPIVGDDGGVCFPARRADAPEPTATPTDAVDRAPCATFTADDVYSLIATPAATPIPPPTVLGGVDIIPLEIGPEIEFPPDIALIIPSDCGNCPGPAGGISRVYRDATGQIRTDTLVTMESLGLSPGSTADPNGAYFTGYAAAEDGSLIAVSVCVSGGCYGGPGGLPSTEVKTAIFLSPDGGVSWSELQGPDGAAFVAAVLPDHRVVVGIHSDKPEPRDYRILPGGESLGGPPPGYGPPISLATGEIVWPSHDGSVVRSDGSQWLGAWADPRELQLAWRFPFDPRNERALASATAVTGSRPASGIIVVFRNDGSLERAYSTGPGYVHVVTWLDDRRVLANANPCDVQYSFCPGYHPAIIDLEARLFHPIPAFLDSPAGVNQILAVQRGPFARVVNTDGTCLNIRGAPGSGGVLNCAAEGVLLRDLGEMADAGGVAWIRVRTPAGVEGWASTQYLER